MGDDALVTMNDAAPLLGAKYVQVQRAAQAFGLSPVGHGLREGPGSPPPRLYRWGDLRRAVTEQLLRARDSTQRASVSRRDALLNAIRERPGTLAEVLGRPPRAKEVQTAAWLLREALVVRDAVTGRYAVNPEPQTVSHRHLPDNGHGVRSSVSPKDGRASGKKRTGHGG